MPRACAGFCLSRVTKSTPDSNKPLSNNAPDINTFDESLYAGFAPVETQKRSERKIMPGEKEGRKPDTEGGVAKQEAEAGGRSVWICWNCHAVNYAPDSWDYFVCWRCGSLVYIN